MALLVKVVLAVTGIMLWLLGVLWAGTWFGGVGAGVAFMIPFVGWLLPLVQGAYHGFPAVAPMLWLLWFVFVGSFVAFSRIEA